VQRQEVAKIESERRKGRWGEEDEELRRVVEMESMPWGLAASAAVGQTGGPIVPHESAGKQTIRAGVWGKEKKEWPGKAKVVNEIRGVQGREIKFARRMTRAARTRLVDGIRLHY
jgi:hypothetical protein